MPVYTLMEAAKVLKVSTQEIRRLASTRLLTIVSNNPFEVTVESVERHKKWMTAIVSAATH
jgi:hypothetical protein